MVDIVTIADGDTDWGATMRSNLQTLATSINQTITAVTAKYTKPVTGIPSDDLAPAVRTQLSLASSAYQKPGSGIPTADLAGSIQNTLIRANAAVMTVNGYAPDGNGNVTVAGGGTAAVNSVNGKTGDVTLAKADVGLTNVDNTADSDKPVSTAQSQAITAKYTKPTLGVPLSDLASGVQASLAKADTAVQPSALGLYVKTVNGLGPDSNGNVVVSGGGSGGGAVSSVNGRTGDVTLAKSDVGLTNVDNTSDANKPVSTAQATAIAVKYTKPSTGIPAVDLASAVQTSLSKADSALQSAPVTSVAGRTGAITLSRSDVGLINVDNTSDSAKPVSTFQATAIGLKYTKPSSGIPQTDLDAASQSALVGGANFNANTLVGDGSTTTAQVNAFLAVGGYRALRGTFTLTSSLIIPSNTSLDATGATINGAATDNLIQNKAAVPIRTTTASSTAGSTTLTSTGANFTTADVGNAVQIIGAGPNAVPSAPGSWYGDILAVPNSTTAIISVPANLTISGATLYIYGPNDNNIEIYGGTWRPGSKNSLSQTQQGHGFRIRRADNVTVHDTYIFGPSLPQTGGQYAMSFGDVTQVTTFNLRFKNTSSDGIHFQGPAKAIIIRDVQGYNTGDDLVAFTGVDGQSQANSLLGDTEGDIIDVDVQNVYGYGVWTHLKITGGTGPGGVLRRVAQFNAEGFYGYTNTGSPINIVNYAGTTTFSGRIAKVYAIGASTSNPQVVSSAGNVLDLLVEGVYWPSTNAIPSTGVVVLSGTHQSAVVRDVTFASQAGTGSSLSPAVYVSSPSISYLEVDATTASDPLVQNFIAVLVASALVCERLVISRHHSSAVTGNAVYFTGTNWAIGTISLDQVHRLKGSWIDGTGTSTNSSDIIATNCDGGSAWVLLRQPANINIAACSQTNGSGAGIRIIGTTATPVVLAVSASNRGSTGLVSKDGSQSFRVAECICIPIADTVVTTAGNGDMYSSATVNSLRLRSAGAWKTL